MRRQTIFFLLAICFVAVLVMELGMVIGGDELSYAYAGQHSSNIENPSRVQCLMDIVRQQWGDYNFRGNGRFLIHSTVAFLSWQHLLIPYRILTAFVWFLFVWLVLHEGKVKPISLQSYFFGSLFVYWFFWYSETAACNACFSGNYLWPACLTLLMMGVWCRQSPWWLLPVSLAFGLLQETFVLPFLGAAFLSSVYRLFASDKRRVDGRKIVSWVLMLIGACVLCFGPASRARASQVGGSFGVGTVQGIVHAMLIGTPALLLLMLCFLIYRHRKDLRRWIEKDLEWWMYFVCAFGLWMMVAKDVYLRTCASWFMAAIVLIVRNRADFRLPDPVRGILSAAVLLWLVIAASLQGVIGYRSYRMLKLYQADEQGVTEYDAVSCGPFFYTCNDSCLCGWYMKFYRLEYGNGKSSPISLPSHFYKTLYQNSKLFFEHARDIGDGLFVDGHNPSVVIYRGAKELSDKQKATLSSYFETLPQQLGWMRYLPGRFRLMYHLYGPPFSLPKSPCAITTKDGETVSLVWKNN